MRLSVATRELHPRRVFRIARGRRTSVVNVFVRLEHEDGAAGLGEASPNAFYNETAEAVAATLQAAAPHIARLRIDEVTDIERAWSDLWPILAPSRAAQCALDLAMWDLLAKRQRVSTVELAWDHAPRPVTTFCTIGLSTAEELEDKIQELRVFPAVKIKSDATADFEAVRRVQAELSPETVAVDANCAWREKDLRKLAQELQQLGAAFIEQPFAPADDIHVSADTLPLPVLADESCVTEEDVERVVRHYAGFNIKLVKCGGLTPGRRMARRGRELGARMMVGCMLESSALIAAGAVVAQATDYADLDGAWLLSDDPISGWSFEKGVLSPPAGMKGLGVEPLTELFS